jgi:hypothetical protein
MARDGSRKRRQGDTLSPREKANTQKQGKIPAAGEKADY